MHFVLLCKLLILKKYSTRVLIKKSVCYFESSFGHFGVFVVKLHPLLDDAAHARLGVVNKLKASDVGTAFPQVCQVNV